VDIEFRVFEDQKLLFRKTYSIESMEDHQALSSIAVDAKKAFWREHPSVMFSDDGVLTQWCPPDAPLAR
jgi:hypothetical protein